MAKVLAGQARLPSEEAMRAEYRERIRAKGHGKAFHSLRDQEVEYVDELLAWVNRDLEDIGRKRLEGHSEQWKVAKEEQVQRIKELFAVTGPERKLEVTCY